MMAILPVVRVNKDTWQPVGVAKTNVLLYQRPQELWDATGLFNRLQIFL